MENIKPYKPEQYNSLSPYLIVDDARRLVDLLKLIFAAKELRRYETDEGIIFHIELLLDDSVIMISNSTDIYKANTSMLHLYVPDVLKTFDLALQNGCKSEQEPIARDGDPDTRGAFIDFAGNYWAVSTQNNTP